MRFRRYGGPAVPAAYDARWMQYVNLTKEQIEAFQAFPDDLRKYTAQKSAERMSAQTALPSGLKIGAAISWSRLAALSDADWAALRTTLVARAAAVAAIQSSHIEKIGHGIIKNRADIDADYAAVP